MARVPHRVNLNASSFPFLAKNMAQTVIIRGQDANYVPPVVANATEVDKDVGIPLVYYCENVMPTAQGYNSVAYENVVPAAVGAGAFAYTLALRDVSDRRAKLGVDPTNGELWVLRSDTGIWQKKLSSTAFIGKLVTAAFVAGKTYVFVQGQGAYEYDFSLDGFVVVTLTGIEVSQTIGAIASNGYLIVWSPDAVAWSSTVDVTDFVPSLTTGAGGGTPEGVKGAITVLAASVSGFVAYTTVNAVACAYSGNSRYPYNFREIVGCGGLRTPELVAVDGNNGVQFAYTSYGLQSVSFQSAQSVQPEVTDFISGNEMETYDRALNKFSYQSVVAMKKKLTLISNRYLVMSYGVSELTHALVYDLSLKRWGKLVQTHTEVFDYDLPSSDTYESAKRSLALMTASGEVWTVDASTIAEGDGLILLGKYQVTRSRLTELYEVVLENVLASATFALKALVSLTGKSSQMYDLYLAEEDEDSRKYLMDPVAGKNVSLQFSGGFSLTFVQLDLGQNGRM